MTMTDPDTPATSNTLFDPEWHDRVTCRTSYTTLARIHIQDDEEFIRDIILDRNQEEYPDPYLRNVYDASILKRYWERVKEATDNYTPETEEEKQEIEEFRERERERVHNQLGYIHYPTPDEYGFSNDFHWDIVNGLSSKDPQIIKKLYRIPLSDLRYLAGWFKVNNWSINPETINTIRYVRDDSTVNFLNTVKVEDYENKNKTVYIEDSEGELEPIESTSDVGLETIIDEIDRINDDYNGFAVVMGLIQLENISNMTTEKTSGGVAAANGKVNIESFDVEWEDGSSWNTIAHEFFHQIQYALSLVDDNKVDKDSWVITPKDSEVEYDVCDYTFVPEIMDRMVTIWKDFCENPVHYLRDYQKKNMQEFYAVAFEAYHEEPEELRKVQPRVYEVVDELMTKK